jgi:hypothetical protein
LIGEQRQKLESLVGGGLQRDRQIHALTLQPLDEFRGVARLHLNRALRKALLELAQHRWKEDLTNGGGGADPETAASPLAEMLDAVPGCEHFPQNHLRMFQQMFTGLREHDLLAHSVQKTTANVAFQRLHRVADGALREEELPGRLSKTARAGKDRERLQLPAVEWSLHE